MAADREVKIITGGSFNVAPEGPLATAMPNTVPPPDPPIPFEDYRSFLVPFDKGSINPLQNVREFNQSGGSTVVSPSPDDATDFESLLPNPGSSSQWVAMSDLILDTSKDAFAARLLCDVLSPAPVLGQSSLTFIASLYTPISGERIGIGLVTNVGFVLEIFVGGISFQIVLCPFAQGSKYDFRWQVRPMTSGGFCLSYVAIKDGVVAAQGTTPIPATPRHPMCPIFFFDGFSNIGGEFFKVRMREFSVGYQPLATPIGSCP